ncbi:hypothetical protein, partial [Streptococcus pneumoniae]|uniref:hypothetical protein n=1 Tax=Streptococcus pneumoniae TaxID=1313 RepID=UPI0018B02A8F
DFLRESLNYRAAVEEELLCREELRVWIYHQLLDLEECVCAAEDLQSLQPRHSAELQRLSVELLDSIVAAWMLICPGVKM